MAASEENGGTTPPGPPGEEREREELHEIWEEAETLADHFRETLISLRDMDLWPRRASILAIAAIVVAALLLATRELPGPEIGAGGGTIPLVQLVGCALLSTLAWSYLLAGAVHAHWGLRLPVLILYTLVGLTFVFQGVVEAAADDLGLWLLAFRLHHFLTAHQVLALARVLASTLPLALPGVVGVCVLVLVWVVVLGRRRTERPRLALGTLLACAAATASLYAVESLGTAFGSRFPIGDALSLQFSLLGTLVLPIVLFVTASDFAEWAEVVAGKAVAGARGVHRAVLPVVAIGSAGAVLADSVRVAGGVRALAGQLVPTLVLGAVALVVGRLLLVRARRLRVPLAGLLAVGVAGYVFSIIGGLRGAGLLVWIAFLGAAAITCVVVGRARPRFAVSALLFTLVLLVAILGDWHWAGRTFLTPEQLRTGGALLCLGGVAFALARYRLQPRGGQLIRLLVVLLLGLQVLDWLSDLFHASSDLELAPLQASVMLLGLLWDVVTSGEAVTNVHGRRVPHHSRVLVYFGYEVLAAAAIVWFYASTASRTLRDTDIWVSGGIQLLGAPLLITFFCLGLASWLRGRTAPRLSSPDDRHRARQAIAREGGDRAAAP